MAPRKGAWTLPPAFVLSNETSAWLTIRGECITQNRFGDGQCRQKKLMANYFVTVIVPVYNAEQTIEACLESLLSQDFPRDRYEIVVVDNNPADSTKDRILKYAVTCAVEDQIQTSYAARNRGIKLAKGEILAFTDSDCVADVSWLSAGIRPFSDPRIGAVGGRVLAYQPKTYIERYQDRRQEMSQEALTDPVKVRNRTAKIITCNAFFRRATFEQIGLFKADLVSGGDYDLEHGNPKEAIADAFMDGVRMAAFWSGYLRFATAKVSATF